MKVTLSSIVFAVVACFFLVGCDDPVTPSATNRPPNAVFGSTPKPDTAGTIAGKSPFTVDFNMCASNDPDRGDSIRFEYYWDGRGDEPDSFGPCRQSHTYEVGSDRGICYETSTCVWDRQPVDGHRVCKTYNVCVGRR